MANNNDLFNNSITDGVKKLLLAGIGAAATSAEKSQEILDELVKKGELTVEQGKALNEELRHTVKSNLQKEEAPVENKKSVADILAGLTPEELAELKAALAGNKNSEA